jgi:ubiquinone/menaquinone biosynthesis C-methylase UbiE
VARYIRLGELQLGVEGAALFRHLVDCDQDFAEQRVAAIQRILAGLDDGPQALGMEVPELDVAAGYAAWAPVYDAMENALIRAEEPLVQAVTADVAPGRAIDVACGTGRHAAWLHGAGHDTTGVDRTPEMLEIARTRVPGASFEEGDYTALRFDDDTFDFAICALALTHIPDPAPAIAEMARVVRAGGRIVLTDAHPTFVLIQGQAMFPAGKRLAFVRNHPHLHGTYLRAFRDAGLSVLDCLESPMDATFDSGLFADVEAAATALWDGIPVALVWSLEVNR